MSKRLSDLNACSKHDFVAALGNVFEYAPWIVERAASARPFDGVQHLFNVMKTVVDQTAPEFRLALIRGHPDLANKAQRAAGLTAESNAEQSGAGLDRLSDTEFEAFALSAKIGRTIAKSQAWAPSRKGSFATITSPGKIDAPNRR
jgi:2-oxo-4-hydroxy-4-carboxy-5-ureidoimidazoline decarboxylase